MKYNFKPKSQLEKFGTKVYSVLVENFGQTFFVGGMVRDLLLKRKVTDVDITTQAKPEQIVELLLTAGINTDAAHKRYGAISAKQGNMEVEITTLRRDLPSKGRYPEVRFISDPKADSNRRDFTVNALYLSLKNREILDFQNGLQDINLRQMKFIGIPEKRIKTDPLRIVRALRFALILKFKLEQKTKEGIKNNFKLLDHLTETKIKKEINKINDPKQKIILEKVINSPKLLDKYFK